MSANTPYAQIVGTAKFYVAAALTAEPAIDAAPGGSWTEIGATDGEQVVEKVGELVYYTDNDNQGDTKSHRPKESVRVRFTLVDLTLEKLVRALGRPTSDIVTTTSGAANVKRLSYQQGSAPTEYALVMKGSTDSPYGNFPGQNYFPRGVFEATFTRTRTSDGRDAVECEFHVLVDSNQSGNNGQGWSTVQIS